MTRTIIQLLRSLLPMLLVVASVVGCQPTPDNGGGSGTGNGQTPQVPEVPETPVSANLFRIDFFSGLDDASFFDTRDLGVATRFIADQSSPVSIAYMFERADFVPGAVHPSVKMAYENKLNPFFLPIGPTSATQSEGCAAVSMYATSQINGINTPTLTMSGINLTIGLSKAASFCLYTARFDSVAQVSEAVEQFGVSLQTDGVLLASVLASEKDAVVDWLKANFKGYRVEFAGSEETLYDLMVMCPSLYVCRSIEENRTINLPYWKVTMEKFF